jgi:hypothetical protein
MTFYNILIYECIKCGLNYGVTIMKGRGEQRRGDRRGGRSGSILMQRQPLSTYCFFRQSKI